MIQTEVIVNEKFNINGEPYFFVEHKERRFAIPDKCPHRGGPLSLGSQCAEAGTIQCPWHGNSFRVAALIKKAIPALRVQDKAIFLRKDHG